MIRCLCCATNPSGYSLDGKGFGEVLLDGMNPVRNG